jgi:nucleotide-binding universal stress UspA family protein
MIPKRRKEVFMYKTILVPLDGSPRAEGILPHVEKLALQFKSNVIFLQVVVPSIYPTQSGPDGRHEYMVEFKQKQDEITAYLTGIRQGFQNIGIENRAVVEQGAVVETIISVAMRENADLIAIASHGRSGLSWVFYGSVAAGVLQKIDRPLLVIRSRNI